MVGRSGNGIPLFALIFFCASFRSGLPPLLFFSALCPRVAYVPNPCFLRCHAKNARSGGPGNVLWLAKLRPDKQPLEIVKIMDRVAREVPGVRCRVVGGDMKGQKRLLRRAVGKRGLEGVIGIDGFRYDVTPCWEWADVFVSTSAHEGYPLTFYEAAACGVPTVSYELPWLSYYRDLDGWDAVPQGDAAAAADRIVRLLKDRAAWEAKSRALHESFARFYADDPFSGWITFLRRLGEGVCPPPAAAGRDALRAMAESFYRLGATALRTAREEKLAAEKEAARLRKALAEAENPAK